MLYIILQSLLHLLFVAVGCFAVLVAFQSPKRPELQVLLFAVILGLVEFPLIEHSFSFPGSHAPLDARSGPLMLIGYLGGPLGALIGGSIAVLAQYTNTNPIVHVGIAVQITTVLAGLAISRIYPPKIWPLTPMRAILAMLVGLVVVRIIAILTLWLSGQPMPDAGVLTSTVILVLVIGAISLLVTIAFIYQAWRLAQDRVRIQDLGHKLELAGKEAGLGIYERVPGRDEVICDAGMMHLYGWDEPPGPVPISRFVAMIDPYDLAQLRERSERLLSGELPTGWFQYPVTLADGRKKEIRSAWQVHKDASGTVDRIVAIHMDITDVIEARRETTVSRNRLERAAANLPGAVISGTLHKDQSFSINYASAGCERIWGVSPEELMADPEGVIQAPNAENWPAFLEMLASAARDGQAITRRFPTTLADGTSAWLELRGQGLPSADGDTQGELDALVLDVTAEVEAQKKVKEQVSLANQAQKMESIGKLTGGVAHDFNNLLAVILGNLELLQEQEDDADKRELIQAGIQASLRGADLTQNMLAFARRARLEPEVLDLNALVRNTQNWAGRVLPKTIALQTHLQDDLWPIEADRSATESALLNLILNARDAMDERGELMFETANVSVESAHSEDRAERLAPGQYVMLAVGDTGTGIPDAHRQQIFEPFFTTKAPGSGSGLGLSMVMGFMKQSGGAVQVHTEPGKGTVFKLFFPTSAEVAPAAERALDVDADVGSEAEDAYCGRLRLLVAEDEPEVRAVLLTALERAGHEVYAAASGDAALEMFHRAEGIDVLITDIVMPGQLQGTDLARELRRLDPTLPVVFMSGYAAESSMKSEGQRPGDIRLMKPVLKSDLLEAVAATQRG